MSNRKYPYIQVVVIYDIDSLYEDKCKVYLKLKEIAVNNCGEEVENLGQTTFKFHDLKLARNFYCRALKFKAVADVWSYCKLGESDSSA